MDSHLDIIYQNFTELSAIQKNQLSKLKQLYFEWNEKINVISRKDFDFFYIHHVLHSLSIAKFIQFKDKTQILDIGTGGGFPGIPLAIVFPNSTFYLCDSIGKKIKVIDEIVKTLEIKNVKTFNQRAETLNIKVDFIISRAVTRMKDFVPWCRNKFLKKDLNKIKNGIIYLKGGDLTEELSEINEYFEIHPISNFFTTDFFETKKIVYVIPKI